MLASAIRCPRDYRLAESLLCRREQTEDLGCALDLRTQVRKRLTQISTRGRVCTVINWLLRCVAIRMPSCDNIRRDVRWIKCQILVEVLD